MNILNYILIFVLFSIGVYGVLVKKNIVKKIIGLTVVTYAVNLFFVMVGYKHNASAPIITEGAQNLISVDPLPQAIVLTAIVIDIAVIALAAAVAVRIYEKFGTFDITEIKNLKG